MKIMVMMFFLCLAAICPAADQLSCPMVKMQVERLPDLNIPRVGQPYLNCELKVQDVADALNTNRTYVSNCIRNNRGCSFSQFVNTYRVDYAKQLLQHPDMKLSEIWTASGFSSESSFFRAFKAITCTTPKGWTAEK